MPANKIKTYNHLAFGEKFIQPGDELRGILKDGFGRFFITRIEDMIKLMKLPVPPNKTTTHTFMFLTQGSAEMWVGSTFYKVRKNECLFVPAGQVFSIGKVDVNSGEGFLLNFSNDIFVGKLGKQQLLNDFEFLTVWGNPLVKLNKSTAALLLPLLQRLYSDFTTQGLKNDIRIQAYFLAALTEVAAAYQPPAPVANTAAVSLSNKFKGLLQTHISTKQKVTDYAKMLHVSPNHLNKAIKQVTGKSPTKWIDETLLLEAKVLLHQTDLTIAQVAAEIAMDDASYFSRLFKKYEGVTPVEYRRRG